ncbi:MAG: FAD-dependent oxidoreductase, partial [Mycobacteriales bacterium]
MAATRVAVIGGGIGGASAALRLARAGADVLLVEAGPELGGLVASLDVGGTPLERFYHHVFPQERSIAALIAELGLTDRLAWCASSVGVLTASGLRPFTTPADLLRFDALPARDRVRLGVAALRMGRDRDWRRLDDIPAQDWLRERTGDRAYEAVWRPLLAAKFGSAAEGVPASWMWGRFDQRRGARTWSGREVLGYLRGGFAQLFDALHKLLVTEGVAVRLGTRLAAIEVNDGHLRGVSLSTRDGVYSEQVDAVLFTAGLPALAAVVPEGWRDPRWEAVGRLGVLCVVLELDRALTDLYWVNVCDPALPFGALIEHTNLVPAADYGGRHVVYLARYFTAADPLAAVDPEEEADRWVAALAAALPTFDPSMVLARHVGRAPYAAPLVQLGQARRVPPLRTPLPGLYLATMAQVHPHDRGMNDGMELAYAAADALLADAGRP